MIFSSSSLPSELHKGIIVENVQSTKPSPAALLLDLNGATQMSGGGIIFWAAEARISEIEEEARHPLDRHPTATAARTVCSL